MKTTRAHIPSLTPARVPTRSTLCFLLGLFGLTLYRATAADVRWSHAAGDGQWGNPDNWSSGNVPTEADRAIIPKDKVPTNNTIYVGADQRVGKVLFEGNPNTCILEGEGLYTLTLCGNGLQSTGGSSPTINSPIVLTEDTYLNSNAWGSRLLLTDRISDNGAGASILVTEGSQNAVTHFAGPIDIAGDLVCSVNTVRLGNNQAVTDTLGNPIGEGGTLEHARSITLNSNRLVYNANIQTSFALDNSIVPISHRIAPGIPLRIVGSGGQLHTYPNALESVEDGFDTVYLDNSNFTVVLQWGGNYQPFHLTLGSILRAPGTYFVLQRNSHFLHVPTLSNDEHGILPSWAMSSNYEPLTAIDDPVYGNSIQPLTANQYVPFTSAENNPDAIASARSDEISLTADTEVWHLRYNRSNAALHLGDHNLTIGSGFLSFFGGGNLLLDSTGGALQFGGDDIIITTTSGSANSTILFDAPLEWIRPQGSTTLYPSLIFPSYEAKSNPTVFSGEDRIGDYYALSLPRTMNVNADGGTLCFAGPSNRTFHGPVYSVGRILQNGSGRLSFRGPFYLRNSSLSVSQGEMLLAADPNNTLYAYDQGSLLLDHISLTGRLYLRPGGTLGGIGTLTQGLTYNANESNNSFRENTWFAPGLDDTPGTLTLTANTKPSGSFGIHTLVNLDQSSLLAITNANKNATLDLTAVPEGATLTLAIDDLDEAYGALNNHDIPVLTWNKLNGSFDAFNITYSTDNPRRIDLSHASHRIDSTTKTLYLTGVQFIGIPTRIYLR